MALFVYRSWMQELHEHEQRIGMTTTWTRMQASEESFIMNSQPDDHDSTFVFLPSAAGRLSAFFTSIA